MNSNQIIYIKNLLFFFKKKKKKKKKKKEIRNKGIKTYY